jgi:hypothetical protein
MNVYVSSAFGSSLPVAAKTKKTEARTGPTSEPLLPRCSEVLLPASAKQAHQRVEEQDPAQAIFDESS